MYSAPHAALGSAFVVGGFIAAGDIGMAVGAVLGAITHDPLDRLNEKPYGGLLVSVIWEAVPLAAFIAAAWWSGEPALFALGWIAGNAIDLWDKKGYVAMLFPGRVAQWHHFGCHTRKPDRDLTSWETKAAAVTSIAVYAALAVLVRGV